MNTQQTPLVLLEDRFEHKAGTEVYEWTGYDYGLRRDDEAAFGVPHICVSIAPGAHPFFTVPLAAIGPVKATGSAA